MPRFNQSNDGTMRATFTVSIRISQEDVKKFRNIIARTNGKTPSERELSKEIKRKIESGLDDWYYNYGDDGEYTGV